MPEQITIAKEEMPPDRFEIQIENQFGTTVHIKVTRNLLETLNDGVKAGDLDSLLNDEVVGVKLA
jgi:hypothetical protein